MAEGRKKVRKYPQLVGTILLLVLLILQLPSALNLPVTNPQQTLEYAPVPPDSDSPPSQNSNFSSLGLGSSSSISGETSGGDSGSGGGGLLEEGKGRTPSTKRCVGNPPKQTSDPMAPPCVAYFDGDNGGATYQGVTREEVRILQIIETGTCPNYKGCQYNMIPPPGSYWDMATPPPPNPSDEWYQHGYLRAWQRYFNDRYQTYNRFVHLYVQTGTSARTPEARRAQAADNYATIKPFAVVFENTSPLNLLAYQEVAAKRGMIVFGAGLGLSSAQYQRFPTLAWGFFPSIEEQAKVFANYVCEKVVPNPVSYSGNQNGGPRKFGLVYSQSAARQFARDFKDEVLKLAKASCGLTIPADLQRTYARDFYHNDTDGVAPAAQVMSDFKREGVTTIIWPLGYETNFSKAGAAAQYFPEWILAGDSFNDGSWPGSYQNQEAWEHAIVVTPVIRQKPIGYTQPCYDAYVEVHPDIPRDGLDLNQLCYFYPGFRQLFTGIQVSGKRLGPKALDKGFRSIPAVASNDPSTPACYYIPGDSTCMKDAEIMWWDKDSDGSSGEISGCWRMALGGKRFLPGTWPAGNINTPFTPSDPCNGFVAGQGQLYNSP